MHAPLVSVDRYAATPWDGLQGGLAANEKTVANGPRSYVLTTADAERWRQLLPAHVNAYGCLEHVRLCERHTGSAARLFVVEAPSPVVACPFFLRPLRELPFAGQRFAGRWDTVTPPYTGPLALGPRNDAGLFETLFEPYCREQGIVAEFGHLHPWDVPVESLDSTRVDLNREVVYVDLASHDAELWCKSLDKERRRQARRAKTIGVRVRRAESLEDVAAFHRLHTDTMKRRRAQGHYYYSLEHFADFFGTMSDNAFFVLAEYADRVVAGGLFFHDNDTIYWDQSAIDMEYARVFPVSAYLYDTICGAFRQGKKRMLLGGGLSPDDGVFRFKARFSPLRAKFCTYKRIHDANAYSAVTSAWAAYHSGALPCNDFFPAYRSSSPVLTPCRESRAE
jgi:serine/alanine adding enzyme